VIEWYGMWAAAAVLALLIGMGVAHAHEVHAKARSRVLIPAANWVRRWRRRRAIERELVRISIRDAQRRDALEPHDRSPLPYRRGWKRGGR